MSQPIKQLLADPETYTTVLLAIVLDQYGTESTEWSPETLIRELFDDFQVRLPQQNIDQLVVGLNLLTSDDFYTRISKFIQICNILAGSTLSRDFDKANAAECAWGITEAALISPPDNSRSPFGREILYYIGNVLDEEGIRQPPRVLRQALRESQPDSNDLAGLPTEDPEMFAAAYGVRADRRQELEEMLSENFSQLLHQLSLVPGLQPAVGALMQDLRSAG